MNKEELLGKIETSRKIFLWVQTGMLTGLYIPLSAYAANRLISYAYKVENEENIEIITSERDNNVMYFGVVNDKQ